MGHFNGQVICVRSADHAFAALKADGSVVTWGDRRHGGDSSEAGLVFSIQNKIMAIYGH